MDSQPATTAERPISRPKQEVIKEAQRIEESLLHSSKGHYAAAARWSGFNITIGLTMAVISAVAGAAAFQTWDTSGTLAGVCSFIVVVLSSLVAFLNPNDRANSHRNAGHSYDALMNKARLFYTIECWRSDADGYLADKLSQLSLAKDELNAKCPQIPRWAYMKAKKGIDAGEGTYKVDKQAERAS
jgi:hypothetical protein